MSDGMIARLPLRAAPAPWRARSFATLVGCLVLGVALPVMLGRAWLAGPFVAIALGAASWKWRRSRPREHGFIGCYAWGFTREDDQGTVRLLGFGEPCGVSVLADHARSRVLIAFTTPTHTRYATVNAADAPAALLTRATTIAESDALALASPFSLSGADALAMLGMIERAVPRATERLFLNGSRGERIAVDATELRVEPLRDTGSRARTFDLRAPLEWRGFMFHESVGAVTTLYQATWVRQGGGEIVFVAPMPHVLASHPDRRANLVGDDVAQVVRGLELLQSLPDAPPPHELRTAIERAFMLPLRQALDRAPRAARNAPPSRLQSSPDHV